MSSKSFGLRNAASTFQRFMDEVVRDLDFIYNFIDDILVANAWPEEHITHIRLLFERFLQYQVRINPDECVIDASLLIFLGHTTSPEGISPLPEKVKAIQDLQPPTSLHQQRHFLGLLNYYRRFISHCGDRLSPLSNLLRNSKKKNEQISLDTNELKAFNELKQKLATTSLLARPASGTQFHWSLMHQAKRHQQQLQPLAYFSKQLKPAEQRNSTFGCELQAMYLAVKYFRYSLESRQFASYTDHRSRCVLSRIHPAKFDTWILFLNLLAISNISPMNRTLRWMPCGAFQLILCHHLRISIFNE